MTYRTDLILEGMDKHENMNGQSKGIIKATSTSSSSDTTVDGYTSGSTSDEAVSEDTTENRDSRVYVAV